MLAILGDDLVALWLHGGTTFADRPLRPGDVDLCVVVGNATPHERDPDRWRADPASRPHRIHAAQDSIARDHGVAFDTMYLLARDVGTGEPPTEAFVPARRHVCWALYRAHWLAGQFIPLHGRRPDDLVVAPTPAELERAMDRELEHLERHVYEGDAADPFQATYAICNGCRILYTLATGSPVVSKRGAGAWALDHLPERWHDAIRAAGRSYDGDATPRDHETLRLAMPLFVEMVRERLPVTEPRPPGPPRWS